MPDSMLAEGKWGAQDEGRAKRRRGTGGDEWWFKELRASGFRFWDIQGINVSAESEEG